MHARVSAYSPRLTFEIEATAKHVRNVRDYCGRYVEVLLLLTQAPKGSQRFTFPKDVLLSQLETPKIPLCLGFSC